ncbi:MAG: ABC transporter substrate-binding protein [Lachnospiraceae bacterium]|nr:ABC transporter substrate-binding protein [Lachnospiraceae bacterium]
MNKIKLFMGRGSLGVAVLLLIVLLFSLLSGCTRTGEEQHSGAAEGFPYTFTDALGNTVTLEKKPERPAILFSSFAEIWISVGGEVAVTVEETIERGFMEEGTVILAAEGPGKTIDLEILTAAEPDLVIVTADLAGQVEILELLKEIGIPAAAMKEDTYEDYLQLLRIFADINGTAEPAMARAAEVTEHITSIRSRASEEAAALEQAGEQMNYLFIRAGSGFSSTKAKTAEDHFACVILDELGGHNIADEAGELSDALSLESILIAQPDRIFVVAMGNEEASFAYMQELLSREGWSSLEAVQRGDIVYLSKEMFNYKPNGRWDESYRIIAKALYPDIDWNEIR